LADWNRTVTREEHDIVVFKQGPLEQPADTGHFGQSRQAKALTEGTVDEGSNPIGTRHSFSEKI
jgi:hypothetical protein